ncbi:MAG: glycerol-3-phosphate responsive antiterminator [Clostridia bacterium]|nr:glycerol-3-phosphate responsive antiterminator [Clostridia bacterium]
MTKDVLKIFENCPVIPAIKGSGLADALGSPCGVVFLLNCDILTIADTVRSIHAAGKKAYIHIDLADGIGKDCSGIKFVKQCGADGIISTKAALIRMAKEQELTTVQRIFALDSKGLASAIETVKSGNPDFVEILPGIALKAIKLFANAKIPVIAGGLISEKSEIFAAIDSGAIAVSTGKKELWNM